MRCIAPACQIDLGPADEARGDPHRRPGAREQVDNAAIRQMLGHERLSQFVGCIDRKAPYRPDH
jgi:hypothetical protein